MENQNHKIGVWEGVANYRNTTFRVCVIAKEGIWMNDLVKAVNRAGGFNVRLEPKAGELDLKLALGVSIIINSRKAGMPVAPSYVIDFEPDHVLTEKASSQRSVTVLMKSDFSIIRDGEYQKPQKKGGNGQRLQTPGRVPLPYRIRL